MKNFLKVILYQPLFNILAFLIFIIPGHSIGVAIIILTMLIRLALIPSSKHAIQAQKRIRDLNPELEAIKKKYPDKQEQSKQIMEFYKINKINPLSGCLPLLIQIPVFFVLYYVFRTGLTTARYDELLYSFTPHLSTFTTGFLWLDLSLPDKFYILPVIAGLLQFIQARQIMPPKHKTKQSDFQDVMQNQTMYIMPLMTIIIALRLPSSLALYWVITTIFTIVQQKLIMNNNGSDKSSVSVKIRQKNN
ncbi:MAG: YidC/Oxa1 family membrane protein insertase [Patescibacteria group bacterium]|jgi:YidC/Oxa1 family membrane protein insertase